MKMKCPLCGVSGKADGSLAGCIVRCPKCTKFFRVPDRISGGRATGLGGAALLETAFPSGGGVHRAEPPGALSAEPTGSVSREPEQDSHRVTPAEDITADPSAWLAVENIDDDGIEGPPGNETWSAAGENDGADLTPDEEAPGEDIGLGEESAEGVTPSHAAPGVPDESFEYFEEEASGEDYASGFGGSRSVADDLGSDDVGAEAPSSGPDEAEKELEAELEAMLAETCSVCGRSVGDMDTYLAGDSLVCQDCRPGEETLMVDAAAEGAAAPPGDAEAAAHAGAGAADRKVVVRPPFSLSGDFAVVAVLRQAWVMTAGAKGAVWGGIAMMFVILFGLGTAAVFLLPAVGAPAGGMVAAWLNIGVQLLGTVLSMVFIAGLINIGVRRVAGRRFSWSTVFSGFGQLGAVAAAGFLMTLLIVSGLFLLVLPGIYLAVGYSLTLPLIIDRGLGPWEAMEASRKAIHNRWWPVFAVYLLMYLVYALSCIPFGLGMIWTIPMFFTLTGVVYRVLLPGGND